MSPSGDFEQSDTLNSISLGGRISKAGNLSDLDKLQKFSALQTQVNKSERNVRLEKLFEHVFQILPEVI
jgi:hypothetical protein